MKELSQREISFWTSEYSVSPNFWLNDIKAIKKKKKRSFSHCSLNIFGIFSKTDEDSPQEVIVVTSDMAAIQAAGRELW